MSLEQLKLMLEMLGAAGAGAQEYAMWWLAYWFCRTLIGYALWFTLGYTLIQGIFRVITKTSEVEKFSQDIQAVLNNDLNSSHDFLREKARRQVLAILTKHQSSSS